MERAAEKGLLDGTEVWMFTDNTTAEAAFFRGYAKSRELHKLVLRLRVLEMKLGIRIWVVHVSGSRMIMTGIDGVSRGDMNFGVMAGADMLSFVPLNVSALKRSPVLKKWLLGWVGNDVEFWNHHIGPEYMEVIRRMCGCLHQQRLRQRWSGWESRCISARSWCM
jgi:hypothetical protein